MVDKATRSLTLSFRCMSSVGGLRFGVWGLGFVGWGFGFGVRGSGGVWGLQAKRRDSGVRDFYLKDTAKMHIGHVCLTAEREPPIRLALEEQSCCPPLCQTPYTPLSWPYISSPARVRGGDKDASQAPRAGATQGSSWWYLKVNSSETLSIFGDKCP